MNTTGDTIGVEIENKSKNLLPAITLNYSLSDKMKIRSSYSETLARAQFREYAPYQFVEFLGADVALGFPFLKNSSILLIAKSAISVLVFFVALPRCGKTNTS